MNTKVLIVDDDPDFREQMEMMFVTRGYETITAESRTRAEEIIKEYTPEIAVIDLMMENDDDGFVLAYKLKRNDQNTKVIMVTNVTGETGIEFPKADDGGGWISADAVLSKPVRFEQIQEALERIGQ
ncbi:hypothetical protein CSA37_02225 [Candidatus Fermentibacteria bacterium]|nr:MAG: hypothetical protein CSA37_02225 [Candidatus Fermentibacteria bacterium]